MLNDLYHARFGGELDDRHRLWKILVDSFFQQFVNDSDTVLDVGAGYCEFINNVRCRKKYAVDLNEDVLRFADAGVEAYQGRLSDMVPKLTSSVDVILMSNFLEHLRSKEEVLRTLAEGSSILRAGGLLLVMQPNIRYAYREYWDFFDHHLPLSDKSLVEALRITGFTIERLVPRFLPYTTKSALPHSSILVKAYLHCPLAWKIMGKQMLVVARRPPREGHQSAPQDLTPAGGHEPRYGSANQPTDKQRVLE